MKYLPHLRPAISAAVCAGLLGISLDPPASAQDGEGETAGAGAGAVSGATGDGAIGDGDPGDGDPGDGGPGEGGPGEGAGAGSTARGTLLERFDAEVSDLTADFEQSRFDSNGSPVDEIATGRFTLLRPGRFRWHEESPFERVITADGENLWDYDIELEQVTRAPIAALEATPALLLSSRGALGDGYQVAEIERGDGLDWVELTPADAAASDFRLARVAFDDGIPVILELIDTLEYRTRIEFFDIEVNQGLDAAQFAFEPPAGVHIVDAD